MTETGLFPAALTAAATEVLAAARRAGLTIATAESCTGGLVAAVLTEIAGSSDVVDRGFVTYSNAAKSALLKVPADLIAAHGAVSGEVAIAMALGAIDQSGADLSVAITGIAGPGGGSADKPLGLVQFAAARRGDPTICRECRFGDLGRTGIRLAAVAVALDLLGQLLPMPRD